ncbi:hypothetical protein [Nocardiopsis composta]|uniref:hypothetical protein n=1 Tax=Nocardiopsis composta TaxID=157465 RepID=UPI00160BCBE1|nr:hypothetical protein [Nocardiopsis composta]
MSFVTDTSPLRAARAAAFTSVCVGVSAIGHAMSGGHHVPAAGLAAAAVPVFALGYAGTARERGLGTVTAWLAWIQLALHLVFSAAQSLAGGSGHGASAHLSAAAETSAQGGGSMIAAHAAAVVVAGWWIRRGEAAAFALARQVRALLARMLPPPAPAAPPSSAVPRTVPATPADLPAPALRALRHAVSRRGPPPLPSPTGH